MAVDDVRTLEYGAYWDVTKSMVDESGWDWVDARIIEMTRAKYQVPDDVPMVVKGRLGYTFEEDALGEYYPVYLPEGDPHVKWFKVGLHWEMVKPDGSQED